MMAFWSGILIPGVFDLQRSIESIEEIAAVNPTIYIHPDLSECEEDIRHILRFGLASFLLHIGHFFLFYSN